MENIFFPPGPKDHLWRKNSLFCPCIVLPMFYILFYAMVFVRLDLIGCGHSLFPCEKYYKSHHPTLYFFSTWRV